MTILDVAERLVDPDGPNLPSISPLTDIAVRINESSRQALLSNADESAGSED